MSIILYILEKLKQIIFNLYWINDPYNIMSEVLIF